MMLVLRNLSIFYLALIKPYFHIWFMFSFLVACYLNESCLRLYRPSRWLGVQVAARGAAIQYQRIQCQQILSQCFVNFYCYLLAIYCKYKQLLYRLLLTNISRLALHLVGSDQLVMLRVKCLCRLILDPYQKKFIHNWCFVLWGINMDNFLLFSCYNLFSRDILQDELRDNAVQPTLINRNLITSPSDRQTF